MARSTAPKFGRGDAISVSKLNRVAEMAARGLDVQGPNLSVGSDGIRLRPLLQEKFLAEITGNDGGAPARHSWRAVTKSSTGSLADTEPVFRGTTTLQYAVAAGGEIIANGTLVYLRRGTGEWYEAEYVGWPTLFAAREVDGSPSTTVAVKFPVTSLFDNGDGTVTVNLANAASAGLISLADQTMGDGNKTFSDHVVQSDKIQQEPSYEVSGRRVSRSAAFQAVSAGGLVDDRNKAFLTIVGDESLRSRVLKDLESVPALRAWKDNLHVHAYAPDHWAVRQVGLAPGITFQAPASDGSNKAPVEWRFRTYEGPVALAEALRKSDPNYRPESDPDPAKKPEPPKPAPEPVKPTEPQPSGPSTPVHLLVVLGLGLLAVLGAYLFSRR